MKKLLLLFLLGASQIQAQNPLLIPDTLSGTNISLNLQNGTHQFFSGITTQTMGANGDILGPTLLLNQGDFVNFSVHNQLGDTTTIHWHGLHVSSENDGGPHTFIMNNDTWTPSFTIMDHAATYWYHPHLHHKTDLHVSKGIAGFIIVRDTVEAALVLPRTYGVDDFPLAIQTKGFDANNEIEVQTNMDDVLMVNATVNPTLQVPAQVVRFRILNGSSQRAFNIGLSQNQTFYQIASDGGLLSNSNAITRLLLAPGERAEILVDLSGMQGQTTYIQSYASEIPNGIYGATNAGMGAMQTLNNYSPNAMNGTNFNILELTVGAPTANPITTIPTSLTTITPWAEASSAITRQITMSPAMMGPGSINGHFLLNGVSFDMDVINYMIPLDNIEIWSLTNQSPIAHPFHIHDVQFYVLDRNGAMPPASEQGRKDVILVKAQETVRFITKFEDFANPTPYMYHCHLLVHEDHGMMGQFVVYDPNVSIQKIDAENLSYYPNPVDKILYLEKGHNYSDYQIYNTQGQLLQQGKIQEEIIPFEGLKTGLYFVELRNEKELKTIKVLKN